MLKKLYTLWDCLTKFDRHCKLLYQQAIHFDDFGSVAKRILAHPTSWLKFVQQSLLQILEVETQKHRMMRMISSDRNQLCIDSILELNADS